MTALPVSGERPSTFALKMKNPAKILITIVLVVTIGLVVIFFYTNESSDAPVVRKSDLSLVSNKPVEPEKEKKMAEGGAPSAPNKEERPAAVLEDDIAIPVEGDPLSVTLAFYPEIGPVSIERYDKEAKPTGKPLKSGTPVQIPNPNIPGEKIHFIVP